MKFDKETIIVFAICIVLLIGWTPFCQYMGWIAKPTEKPAVPASVEKPTTKTESIPSHAEPTKPVAPTSVEKVPAALPNLPPQQISNNFFDIAINPVTGTIDAVKLLKYPLYSHTGPVSLFNGAVPPALSIGSGGTLWKSVELLDNNRSVEGGFSLTRKVVDGAGKIFELTQNWKIYDNYATDYEIVIRNPGKSVLVLEQVAVHSGSLPPLHQLSGDTTTTESHNVDLMQVDDNFIAVSADAKESKFKADPVAPVKWLGITNKYFCTILLAEKPFDGVNLDRQKIDVPKQPDLLVYSAGAIGLYKRLSIEPGAESVLKFKVYAGPKIISEFKKFDPSVAKVMHLSWGPLDWLARMMLVFLVFLKSFCGSYGWSIIALTLIVRLAFWPVTQKANNSMKKMQKLQPKMTEIRTQYKDTPQLMNTKMMELYKQEGVNPLGGCFPILLQIPVFFALYATLDGAIELRQVSFWWAKDLTLPDTIIVLFNLIPINPLVLVMTGLMVLQQKMTPAPVDPMQQKMLMFMPIVMLFVLYSLPSGLTLYWTVSQIFSILQLYATQKFSKDDTAAKNNPKPKLKNA